MTCQVIVDLKPEDVRCGEPAIVGVLRASTVPPMCDEHWAKWQAEDPLLVEYLRAPAPEALVWCVTTTKSGVTEDASAGWITRADAERVMSLFAGHVLRTHPDSTLKVEDANAWAITYADGQVRYVDLVRRDS